MGAVRIPVTLVIEVDEEDLDGRHPDWPARNIEKVIDNNTNYVAYDVVVDYEQQRDAE